MSVLSTLGILEGSPLMIILKHFRIFRVLWNVSKMHQCWEHKFHKTWRKAMWSLFGILQFAWEQDVQIEWRKCQSRWTATSNGCTVQCLFAMEKSHCKSKKVQTIVQTRCRHKLEWLYSDYSVRSADLQKVGLMMISRMPGCKTAAFTSRVVAFNETFAVMGKHYKVKRKHLAVTWHEATAGRKAQEIASAYVKALKYDRYQAHYILAW